MNNKISGKSKLLKRYANVHDTVAAIERIIAENYLSVVDLANSLKGNTQAETFQNIWDFVRQNIRYQNDEKGIEQLRTPQRTLHDKIGDCDDFSILISAILTNLNITHELVVAAYKSKDKWQHIYPAAYDYKGDRYVIDCVPEIPRFNFEAKPIKNKIIINMRLEELGSGIESEMISELTQPFSIDNLRDISSEDEEILDIQGLLGNVVLVSEDDEYDTVLSSSELKQNIILKQLIEAKTALQNEIDNPTELSQLNDNQLELELVSDIIDNFSDEYARDEAIEEAINHETLYQNFYKTINYGINDAINGLAGDDEDDAYYLKIMDEQGLLDEFSDEDSEEDLGRRKKRRGGLFKKAKSKLSAFKKKHPKLSKIGRGLAKFSPHGFALRKSLEVFIRANTFRLSEKIAIGYTSESQARKLGYNRSEWLKFVEGKNKAESKWNSLGGEKSHFQKMIKQGRGGKKAGLRGELGVAPAVIAAVTKAFGAAISFFKNLKLKNKAGKVVEDTSSNKSYATKTAQTINMENNTELDEKSGVVTETITDDNGKETIVYRDKDGNEIGKVKAFFLKHQKMIMIISIVLVVGIIAIIIWKVRQRALNGLGAASLSAKQENYLRRQGLNKRAIASLIREEIAKDGKKYNKTNRKTYYKKVFTDAFSRPISDKQASATLNHNDKLKQVRTLAKQYGGGSEGWKKAWSQVKKK